MLLEQAGASGQAGWEIMQAGTGRLHRLIKKVQPTIFAIGRQQELQPGG